MATFGINTNYTANIPDFSATSSLSQSYSQFANMLGGGAATGAAASTGSAIDFLNSDTAKVGDTSSLVAGMQTINSSAIDAATAANAKQGEQAEMSETGKALSSARQSYMKANFPGMTDEQIAALDQFYAAQYAQYEEQMGSFLGDIAAVAGTSVAGATGPNTGIEGLLAAMQSQVGWTESGNADSINAITGKSGLDCREQPWCAAWAMNMLNDYGVLDISGCDNVNYCPTIKNWAQGQGTWQDRGSYTPQAGDAILFNWDGSGTAQHIGIVTKVENGQVYTIEGNSSNSVASRSYSLGSGNVLGYINCAAQK